LKIIFLAIVLMSMSAFAVRDDRTDDEIHDIHLICDQLIDGNANHQARMVPKRVAFEILVTFATEKAEFLGSLIAAQGSLLRENQMVPVKIDFSGYADTGHQEFLQLSSQTLGTHECPGVQVCNRWTVIKVDMRTGLTTLTQPVEVAYAQYVYDYDMKFKCVKRVPKPRGT
jgi:hypothetical protein